MRDIDSFKYIGKRQARKKKKKKDQTFMELFLCVMYYIGVPGFPLCKKGKLGLRDVGNLLRSVG